MSPNKHGMALVTTIAVVTLVALLSVTTLSLSTRVEQGSYLAVRDARLNAASGYALATVIVEWRTRSLGSLAVGGTRAFPVAGLTSPPVSVTITRTTPALFWVVAQATGSDGSVRRENLILVLETPTADSIPPILSGGSVVLSDRFRLTVDSTPGCSSSSADLMIGTDATVSSSRGAVPALMVERSPLVSDSSFMRRIGPVEVESFRSTADLTLAAGTTTNVQDGVVYATGDLTLTGGTGEGLVIVNGRLTIAGPITFTGIIVARNGIRTSASGAVVIGAIRAGPANDGESATVDLGHEIEIRRSPCALQTVLGKVVTPRPARGRRWAEMY